MVLPNRQTPRSGSVNIMTRAIQKTYEAYPRDGGRVSEETSQPIVTY